MMANPRSAKVRIGTSEKDWAGRLMHSEGQLDSYADYLDDASKTASKQNKDQF